MKELQNEDGLYIPNPSAWQKFYAELAQGYTSNPERENSSPVIQNIPEYHMISLSSHDNQNKNNNSSSSLYKPSSTFDREETTKNIQLVSPTQQVVSQAEAEIVRNPNSVSHIAIKEADMTVKRQGRNQKGGSARQTTRKSRRCLIGKKNKRIVHRRKGKKKRKSTSYKKVKKNNRRFIGDIFDDKY